MAHFATSIHDFVGEIVLNQPNKLNVISPAWANELSSHVKAMESNDNVRVILIWAEGRMFTAGLDLKQVGPLFQRSGAGGSPVQRNVEFFKSVKEFQQPMTLLEGCFKPVVVAIHGKCIGGGVDLATACDIRLCTKDAEFNVAETPMAILADLGTIPRLTKIIGKGIYKEMIFTGDPLGAERALQCGLVNKIYEDKTKLLEGARQLCQKIASNSPLVVQSAKRVLKLSENLRTEETLDYLALWNTAFIESEDLVEAMTAFMRKQKPKFINKL